MAKVTGPLYSETAHGEFNKTLEYSRQRGQNIVTAYRRRVRPASPVQTTMRDSYRIANAIIARVNATNWNYEFPNETWIEYWTLLATDKQSWNNAMTIDMVNPLGRFGFEIATIWSQLFDNERENWNRAATTEITNLPSVLFDSITYPPGFALLWAEHTARRAGYGPPLGRFSNPFTVFSAPR